MLSKVYSYNENLLIILLSINGIPTCIRGIEEGIFFSFPESLPINNTTLDFITIQNHQVKVLGYNGVGTLVQVLKETKFENAPSRK
jgi:hypothetical protein